MAKLEGSDKYQVAAPPTLLNSSNPFATFTEMSFSSPFVSSITYNPSLPSADSPFVASAEIGCWENADEVQIVAVTNTNSTTIGTCIQQVDKFVCSVAITPNGGCSPDIYTIQVQIKYQGEFSYSNYLVPFAPDAEGRKLNYCISDGVEISCYGICIMIDLNGNEQCCCDTYEECTAY